jgi:hypothetical protein
MDFVFTAFPVGAYPSRGYPILSFPGYGAEEEAPTREYGGAWFKRKLELQRDHIIREDKELMEFLSIIVKAGLLN